MTFRSTIPHGKIPQSRSIPRSPGPSSSSSPRATSPAQPRGAHRRRPAAAGRHEGAARDGADRARRAPRPRAGLRGARAHHGRVRAADAVLTIDESLAARTQAVRHRQRLQGHPDRAGRRRARPCRGGGRRRRRLPASPPGARLHREQRHCRLGRRRGTLVVMGSMQCPYYVHKALKGAVRPRRRRVRVIQTTTGGGFGGKEEYPNDDRRACRAAGAQGRTAGEDHLRPPRGHGWRRPSGIPRACGTAPASRATARLVAQDIDIVMDGGAYVTLSPVVLSRGALHATGPYACPERAGPRARAWPPTRRRTAPSAASERRRRCSPPSCTWSRIAAALGVDSLTLRRGTGAGGLRARHRPGARAKRRRARVLDRCVQRSGYRRRRREYARCNRDDDQPMWSGIGLALVPSRRRLHRTRRE